MSRTLSGFHMMCSTLSPLSQVSPRLTVRCSTEPRQTPLDFLYSVTRIQFVSHPLHRLERKKNSRLTVVRWISLQVPLQGLPRKPCKGTTKCHVPHLSQGNNLVLPKCNQESVQSHPIRDLVALIFNFTVYGLELLVSVWFVIVVMTLVFACLFGCVLFPRWFL
jgi:hypothetical protein